MNTVPLVLYLVVSAFIGFNGVPSALGDRSVLLGDMFMNIFFCWCIYLVGIWLTKQHGTRMKKFYFYPLFLHTIMNLVYSCMVVSAMSTNLLMLGIAFFASLMSFLACYVAGIIIVRRDLQGKELYFHRDSFSASLLYIIPSILITPPVCYFFRNNHTGLFAGTCALLFFGGIFFYLIIAAEEAESVSVRPGYVKYILWALLWGTSSAVTVIVAGPLIHLQIGNFPALWVSASSIPVNFLVLHPIAVIAAGLMYHPESPA